MESFISPKSERIILSDGTEILMEVENGPYDGPVSVQELEISAKRVLRAVSSLAQDLRDTVQAARPDKATVEFTVEFSSENAVGRKPCEYGRV